MMGVARFKASNRCATIRFVDAGIPNSGRTRFENSLEDESQGRDYGAAIESMHDSAESRSL